MLLVVNPNDRPAMQALYVIEFQEYKGVVTLPFSQNPPEDAVAIFTGNTDGVFTSENIQADIQIPEWAKGLKQFVVVNAESAKISGGFCKMVQSFVKTLM